LNVSVLVRLDTVDGLGIFCAAYPDFLFPRGQHGDHARNRCSFSFSRRSGSPMIFSNSPV
jgi:hypothetical protein